MQIWMRIEDQVDKAIDRDIHNNMDSNDESSIEDEANQANDSSELDKAQVMPAAKIIRNSSNKELKRVAITLTMVLMEILLLKF